MEFLPVILGFIGAYLIGSIPTAIWYGRTFHKIDVRDHGSGNAGATNTFRVLGKQAGTIVFLVDVTKAFISTFFIAGFVNENIVLDFEDQKIYIQLICGLISVIGHVFPVFAQFRGGKGVASLLGMVIALHPLAALVCFTVFVFVFIATKYVSVGSMCAALAFPIFLSIPRLNGGEKNHTLIGIGLAIFALVVYTHRKNITRLMKGEENKMSIIKRG